LSPSEAIARIEDTTPPRPRFVVFDLDGTLVDSQAGILNSFHTTLRERGVSATDAELLDLIGPPLGDSFARLGFAADEIDEVVTLYRHHYDREGIDLAHLYDGVEEMLKVLGDSDVRLAVATAKRVDFAIRMLENLGVLDHFECVSGVSIDGRLTTKKDVVGDALVRLNEPQGHGGWMAGDRREDVLAALAHGLVPIGVLWGYGSRDELAESGARLVVASPLEIPTLWGNGPL
jgi:phosphoglycolate phosphatase